MCLVRIREDERIRLRGCAVVRFWLRYAIDRHLHPFGAVVADIADVEARAGRTWPDGERFPIPNRCAGDANLSLYLTRCTERYDRRVVGIVHRPQHIRGAAAQRQPARFWQLAEHLQRSRPALRQIARQLVATGRPGDLRARTKGAYRRVPRYDGKDDEESREVRLTSQHPQPSFRQVLHKTCNCNIETASRAERAKRYWQPANGSARDFPRRDNRRG